MNVFLDLEETVLNNWEDGLLVNTDKVRDWLAGLNVTQVHLFSFAVWNDKDKDHFTHTYKPLLEKALGVTFVDAPSVEDFMDADREVTGVRLDSLFEYCQLRGKVDGFRSWCKLHFDKQHNVLLDDVVPNATWHDTDSGLKLQYVNVKDLV